MEKGWVRLNVPTPYAPFAEGAFLTPSGKCEFYSERLEQMGFDPAHVHPALRECGARPALVAQWPLTLISSPAHQFLNSSFVNVDALRRSVGKARMHHPPRRRLRAGSTRAMRSRSGTGEARSRCSPGWMKDSSRRGLGAIRLVDEVRGGWQECE